MHGHMNVKLAYPVWDEIISSSLNTEATCSSETPVPVN